MNLKNVSHQLGDRVPAAHDVLHWMGLREQRAANDMTFAMLGIFALGTLVGGALALLFAPRTGRELRQDLGEGLGGASERVKETLSPTPGAGDCRSAGISPA